MSLSEDNTLPALPFSNNILDSMGEGLFTVNKDFKINFFNKAAEHITGLSREEVIGKFCKNVFRSDFCFNECPIARVLESGHNIYDLESRIQCKDGKLVNIRLNAAILKNSNNEAAGGVISFRDISRLKIINESLKPDTHFFGIVGSSKSMQEIYKLIEDVAHADAPVFIQGETGTGKEMIANAIQITSRRKDKKYVKVNCTTFPAQMLASELFGHVKGAFTDAIKDRIGRFEYADQGTLFLDEIAEMHPHMQVQLLRILQAGTFERLGESLTRKADVRIIAATNMDIKNAIAEGKFREDLFYRLNVIPVNVPPLRERCEDIPLLSSHFILKFSRLYKKEIKTISREASDLLISYPYPGNVRELENIIEYAFIRTKENSVLEADMLPSFIHEQPQRPDTISAMEADLNPVRFIELLEKYNWNKTKVAKALGVNRTTVWRKLKLLGIDSR
ncbi:MAG: sigma-54 interaction domain-containing protein [Syntrophothermus sp.]